MVGRPCLLYTSIPDRQERARHTAWLITANERGDPLPNIYDPTRGY